MTVVKAIAEDETRAPAAEAAEENESSSSDQTVSVPVSPSDMLTMFFKVPTFLYLSLSSSIFNVLGFHFVLKIVFFWCEG